MGELRHGRTCVFNINYHIVWSTKYRRNVLTSKIETILKEYPEISEKLWNGELWNPSYYVETIGSISEEAIRKYIQNQEKE